MRVLFLSALDFKQKSIQVIVKTPLAYAERGWDVTYIVARDTRSRGNYSYESVINPPGVNVQRFEMPLRSLRDRFGGRLGTVLNKLTQWLVVCMLASRGLREIARGSYDVVYGYEVQGVLAANLVRLLRWPLGGRNRPKFVARFQGVVTMAPRPWYQRFGQLDIAVAAWLPSDLCVMTDDGTRGRTFLKLIRARHRKLRFYVNGLDPLPDNLKSESSSWEALGIRADATVLLTVSRLVNWKRVDRAIRAFHEILRTAPQGRANSLKLIIVGDGSEAGGYRQLSRDLGIDAQVIFTGARPHQEVAAFMQRADVFFSFYDLSNVGNPLLEAIQQRKVIFTLRNGDTGRWITHRANGMIFDPDDQALPANVAREFWILQQDDRLRQQIERGVDALARRKLWSWQERLDSEVAAVRHLTAA